MARNNPRRKQASRRQLLSYLAAGTMAVTVVPRHVLGGPGFIAPSERVRMAGIGVGGMGGGDVATLTRLGAEYVALCDVDEQRIGALLIWDAVILKFDEEIFLTEDVLKSCRFLQCAFFVAIHQRLEHMATEASGGRNETLVVRGE